MSYVEVSHAEAVEALRPAMGHVVGSYVDGMAQLSADGRRAHGPAGRRVRGVGRANLTAFG